MIFAAADIRKHQIVPANFEISCATARCEDNHFVIDLSLPIPFDRKFHAPTIEFSVRYAVVNVNSATYENNRRIFAGAIESRLSRTSFAQTSER
jgi:hypothetical protein